MPNDDPLPTGQQMLLQRLMAAHVWTDDEAQEVFNSIIEDGGVSQDTQSQSQESQDDVEIMGTAVETLAEAFCSINKKLTPGFGLEIVTMVDAASEENAVGTPTKYHAVVNTHIDEVSKSISFEKAYNPHEREFIRLLLKTMVEDEESGDGVFALKRKDCINLRSKLENGFKLKVHEAERIVQVLLDEQWLRVSTRQDESDDDNDDDSLSQSQSRAKKRRRRESVQNKLELAPRAFLELSHYLQDLGLDPEDLPQFLSHKE